MEPGSAAATALRGRVAVVAGGTRGAGRGIAVALGACGATVYVTGRSSSASGPSELGRSETIEGTAQLVDAAGGRGIAVRCDHMRIDEVDALRARIESESGRLDVLVNDIWGGEALIGWGVPFWEHDLEAGLRAWRNAVETHLITSHRLVPLLVANGSGLVIEVTDGDSDRYRGSLFYDLAKASAIRLALAQSSELAPHGVAAVSLTPGFLRSEEMLDHFGVTRSPTGGTGSPRIPTSRSRRRPRTSGARWPPWRADPDVHALERPGAVVVGARSRVRLPRRRRLAARLGPLVRRRGAGRARSDRRGRRAVPLRRQRRRHCGRRGLAQSRGAGAKPAALAEPPAHRADARHLRVIPRVTFSQPRDRRQDALATRKALLGLAPQPRPGIRPGRARTTARPSARTASECAASARERARVRHPCDRQTRRSVTPKSRPALEHMNSGE